MLWFKFLGIIHLFMNGFLPCSKIDMNILTRGPCDITTISMSTRRFATFSATCRQRNESDDTSTDDVSEPVKLVAFNVPLLATW